MENLKIAVGGMSCEGCVKSVTRVLAALPGVVEVSVSLSQASASLQYDPGLTSVAVIKEAVNAAGFEAGDVVQ